MCQVPMGLYRVRCIGTNNTKSSSENAHDMMVLECEIIDPPTVDLNGRPAEVAGRKFTMWLHMPATKNWGLEKTCQFMDKLKIEYDPNNVDPKNHKEYFHAMEWDMVLDSEEDVLRKPKQPGQKVGDPVLDGQGNPISRGWRVKADSSMVPDYCNPIRNPNIPW